MVYNEQETRAHYRALTKFLIKKKLTITTMESATSGQIASLITDTEGSSAVMKGAFITYSNEAKIRQGVPAEIIEKYSVYSRETAKAMALACMKAYAADIGIGVTGTMGNADPANPAASVPGQVYFAIGMKKDAGSNAAAGGGIDVDGDVEADVEAFYVELEPQPSRLAYKLAVAEEVFRELVKKLPI